MTDPADLPAAKARAIAVREQMLDVISSLGLETLAYLARHEYDDDLSTPADHSAGADFLFAARDAFVAWVRREGRFPTPAEADSAATTWHRQDATGSQVAEAYVGLALYFSAHAADVGGADISGLTAVLDNVAGTLAYNLSWEYGPSD